MIKGFIDRRYCCLFQLYLITCLLFMLFSVSLSLCLSLSLSLSLCLSLSLSLCLSLFLSLFLSLSLTLSLFRPPPPPPASISPYLPTVLLISSSLSSPFLSIGLFRFPLCFTLTIFPNIYLYPLCQVYLSTWGSSIPLPQHGSQHTTCMCIIITNMVSY